MPHKLLEYASKFSDKVEIFQAKIHSIPVKFEANRLKQIITKDSLTTAMRIIKDDKIGFSQAIGQISPTELTKMALETSEFGAIAKFDFPTRIKYPELQIYDPKISNLNNDDIIDAGQKLIDTIVKHTPEIVCDVNISRGIIEIDILNTNGGHASYKKSYFTVEVEGVVAKNNDILYVGDRKASCSPFFNFKTLTDEVIKQLEYSRKTATFKSGTFPVIFTPQGVASVFIAPILAAFNGKIVYNRASPLCGKLGKKEFDHKLNIYDDPTVAYNISSAPCDDEAVATRKLTLIENGIISHFFYDLQTAGLAGTDSTGHGNRNGGIPSPAIHALIIENGDTSPEDMLADIDEGLLVFDLMGATQGNILNGDFSGNVLLGFKVEKGHIVGRVKDTMISGNIYELLNNIQAIGNDSRWIGGFLKTPSLYHANVAVAVKGR